jgi:methionyl-tRNA formyltransferase
MRDLRIVFMGTPDFAVASLAGLLEAGYTVAGVITTPDKPAGRGRKLHESAVKKFSMANGLPLLQPPNLKEEAFLTELKALKANLQIVVAFRMLPRDVWEMPEYGTFNLHASLLPDYRGAAPINWAIINGEKTTGVTTFFIDDKIDTGAILLQRKVPIGPEETAGELHDTLMETGARLVLETVRLIEADRAVPIPQKDLGGKNPAPKLNKDNCRIQWDRPLPAVFNQVRGLSPYPAAWSIFINGGEELNIRIFPARPIMEKHTLKPGSVTASKDEIKVAVPGGFLSLLEMQLAGKRRLAVKEVLNGLSVEKNAFMA